MSRGSAELPTVSVVVPVRDRAAELGRLLESLRHHAPQRLIREVLVVDDGSRESVAELCSRYEARCLRQAHSRGPAAARNLGAGQATAPILLFLDADVVCPDGLLEHVVAAFEERPGLVALSFRNQRYDARDPVVRNFGAALEHFWLSSYLTEGASLAALSGVTSRNAAVRREAFGALGGFDESFVTNAIEDYDFGKRASALGPTFLAAAPEPRHDFPAEVHRLLRNYWVRASLFVPYYLTRKPPLDRAQVSGGEAVTRLFAALAAALAAAALWPGPALPLSAMMVLTLGVYGVRTLPFLRAARRSGASPGFAAAAFLLHWLSSLVIVAGACWGLVRYAAGRPNGQGWRSQAPVRR